MARRALYREYRPETFSEVIGQDHITTILKNQVREGKLSHAYLFCGSRGTGKTTSAKILSRAVNCLSPKDGEPCGVCAACRLIKNGSADVIEIDAASNNSVDNVRSLIEQAQFAPLELKYRVFIIDEVHMLSNAAFNALLKTLEEPPKHVLFILATTEPQKLPATIISRCQRFDFHRLTIAHIVTNLSAVLEKAGASIEPNGLRLIARAADGGMRDALSLADQCLSYAGDRVTEQDVLDALGSVSSAVLEETARALLSGNGADAVRALDDVVRNGRDLGVFLSDLSKHFRALLLAKTCGDCKDLLDCTDDQMARYLKVAKGADEARILYAMEQILAVQSKLRLFPAPRIPIETAFLRICRPADDTSFAALEARVALLEARPAGTTPVGGDGDAREARDGTYVTKWSVLGAPHDVLGAPHDDPAPPWDEPPMPEEPPMLDEPPEPAYESEPTPNVPHVDRDVPGKTTPVGGDAPPTPTPTPAPVASGEAETVWEAAKKKIMELNPMVYFYVKDTRGAALEGDTLTVEFPATQESSMNGMRAERNLKIAKSAIEAVRPGTSLVFRLAALMDKNEEKLKELFGSSLTIK
ncbi:MAG: DNA polymerase III subunit gamma/tau [Clostridia bacterium]|nr:DNA polymerase III subunit gamma/tau [Clostridia bacterium]